MRLAAIIALLPTLAAAGPYDGVYKQVANADCANIGVDGGALKIEDGIFYGVEVECRMTRPVDVLQMDATLYTMQCSGGDQIWTERAMLMDSAEDDGILMIWNGYAFAYAVCEPSDP
jgi:hypothetical protein